MLKIGAALFYYKLGQMWLQIGAALLLQIEARVVTNWGRYYSGNEASILKKKASILGIKL